MCCYATPKQAIKSFKKCINRCNTEWKWLGNTGCRKLQNLPEWDQIYIIKTHANQLISDKHCSLPVLQINRHDTSKYIHGNQFTPHHKCRVNNQWTHPKKSCLIINMNLKCWWNLSCCLTGSLKTVNCCDSLQSDHMVQYNIGTPQRQPILLSR